METGKHITEEWLHKKAKEILSNNDNTLPIIVFKEQKLVLIPISAFKEILLECIEMFLDANEEERFNNTLELLKEDDND